jgi:multiple sugar transport system substrate-binding protein
MDTNAGPDRGGSETMRFLRAGAAAACVLVLALAGCGGDDEESTKGAEKAPAVDAKSAKGNVTWCIGKDTSGAYGETIDLFKKANPNVKVTLRELPESADEQRTQLVQRLRAKNTECDVLGMDVIWTAEFAAQGWLQDVGDIVDKRKSDFIPSTLNTAKFEDKYWAVPYHTNAGFLYYRTDQAPQAPDDWAKVYSEAKSKNGLVYQGARYEGLTVCFLELLYSAGGKALSDDGKKVEVDSAAGRKVMSFMANGLKDGAVPEAVTTYMEQPALFAFQRGKATFMRNWPYAYALNKESDIGSKFDIAPFPKFGGGEAASVLGGINLAISAYSKNAEAASAFIDFATSETVQKANFPKTPVATAAPYDDPAMQKEVPFAKDLKKAVEQGQARPASPVYPQISEAIYENVHDALQGKAEPDAALKNMKSQMEKAIETF